MPNSIFSNAQPKIVQKFDLLVFLVLEHNSQYTTMRRIIDR